MKYNIHDIIKNEFEPDDEIKKAFNINIYYTNSLNHMLKVIANPENINEITFRINDNILVTYDDTKKFYIYDETGKNDKKLNTNELIKMIEKAYETETVTLEIIL